MKQNYYVKNKVKMYKSIKKQVDYLKCVLTEKMNPQDAECIIEETYEEFEKLLPQLPYIGGMENQQTKKIVGTAPFLCFYKVMKLRNISVREIGEITYEASYRFWNSYPKIIGLLFRRLMKTKYYYNKMLLPDAKRSQLRKYENDFVYSANKGNSDKYDIGMDYHECGICKYFHEQGADEFTPYMCLLDFAQSDAMKLGLERNSTIAEGGCCCDFKMKIGSASKKDLSKYFSE